MNLQQIVDDIRNLLHNKGITEVIFDVNKSVIDFALKTRVLYAKAILTRTNDLLSEDLINYIWTYKIPSDVYEIRSADCCNQEEMDIIDTNKLRFTFVKNINSNGGIGPTTDIELIYDKRPAILVNPTDICDIPERFMYGIISNVKAKYYSQAGVLQNSGWEKSNYK